MLLMLDYIICISLFCGILVQAPNPILDKGEVLNGYVETTESELGVSLELVDEKDLKNRPMIEANNTEYELGTSLLSLTGEIVPCRSKQATPVKKSALLQGLYDERSDCSPKCFGRKRPQSLLLTSDPYNFSESEEYCNVDLHTSFRQEYSFFRTSTPKKLRTYEKKLQNQDNFTIEVEGELGTSLTELDDSISLMPEMPTPVKTKGQIISNKSLEELIMDDSVQKEITARKDKSNSLLEKAIESSVDCIMNARLCKHECLVSFSFDAVKELRYKLWTKDYRRRVEWFHDYYTAADTIQGQLFFTVIKGKRVCSKCFRDMFKINKNFFFTWKRRFELGAISTGFRRGRSVSKSSDEAEIWLQEYARFRGDSLPDRAITQLPYKTRKNDVYECYKDEKLMNDEIFVSRSQFYSLWKTKFKHLQIKQTNSFSRCETCTTLSTRLEKTRNKDERQELKKNILVHNNRQMAERKYYYAKRKRSEENKRQYLSLIIDGMDQSKTNLPHFTGRRSKGLDAAHLLQTHVQGIINHGLNRITTFVDINEYSHDSNLIMNTLLKEIYDTSIHMGSYLPETIYIQADNCFRENKNRYVLSFCELLVRKNVFKEVHLSFLYVGHTHEDIDASFSKIAEKLRKHDAETFPDLMALLPNSKETRGLYDIKGWLEKEINPIKGHTTPLHFKFSRKENEKFQCEYKKNNNVSWKKMERPLLNKIPSGIPKILEPSNLKKLILDHLKKTLKSADFCSLILFKRRNINGGNSISNT